MWYNYSVSEMNYQLFQSTLKDFACFSTQQVLGVFPDFDRNNYHEWLARGYLVRMRRGWYAFADSAKITGICDYIAGKIYAPSYLSCEYVLARVGLIPESVVQLTSVTTNKTAFFRNDFGEFGYRSIKPELMFGFRVETVGPGLPVSLATPVKALCDFLYLNSQYRTASDMEELRLDADVLGELLSDGSLGEMVRRFSSPTLTRRVETLKEVYGV